MPRQRLVRLLVVSAILGGCALTAAHGAIPVPAPPDPLIVNVDPRHAQQGQQVVLFGINFGAAPLVSFNGAPATVVAHRPVRGYLVATVPAGATSGPLTVTDTISALVSNAAEFQVDPGAYTPACTIAGIITVPGATPRQDVVVVATDTITEEFVAAAVTDPAGGYSLALPASVAGYQIFVDPPASDPYVEHSAPAACPGTLNHELVPGFALSGTVRSADPPHDPLRNAFVLIEGPGISGAERLTGSVGQFTVTVPPGTYEIFVNGPIGQRYVAASLSGVSVVSNTSVGDIDLASGVLLIGIGEIRDGDATRALMGAGLILFDDLGFEIASSGSIADGRFFVPAPAGGGYRLRLEAEIAVGLDVRTVDLPADVELPDPITMYDPTAQISQLPTIIGTEESVILQADQPLALLAMNIEGAVEVRFPDGVGGFLNGIDTLTDGPRPFVATRVPPGAVSGEIHLQVDGVDGPGFPIAVLPGTYNPGAFTVSGVISNGVGAGVENVLVALFTSTCADRFIDYTVTSATGSYSLGHPGGNGFGIYMVPLHGSGLSANGQEDMVLAGNLTINMVLPPASPVGVRLIASGVGPVGTPGAPVQGALVAGENIATGLSDELLSNALGQVTLELTPGLNEFIGHGPYQSRYLATGGFASITGPIDLGDAPIDSGFFIAGRVVDPVGSGLAGVEVVVIETFTSQEFAFSRTDAAGWFRAAVPTGIYQLYFQPTDEQDFFVPAVDQVEVFTDTLVYPPVQAQFAGRIQGTIYLPDGTTPATGVGITAWTGTGLDFVTIGEACDGAIYEMRVPAGAYLVQAQPSFVDPCLANEYFPNAHYICQATPVVVPAGVTVPGVDFVLEAAGMISGSVVDDLGFGVTGAAVCVDNGPSSPACALACIAPGFDGSFSLPSLPAGVDYRLSVSSGSFTDECWNDHLLCTGYDPIPVGACSVTPAIQVTLSNTAGSVPDGSSVGAPMTVEYEPTTDEITVQWEPACSSSGHAVYFHTTGSPGTYDSAICSIGVDGLETFVPPAGDLLWWVIVGTNETKEGSYGLQSSGVERPESTSLCGFTQDLSASCAGP